MRYDVAVIGLGGMGCSALYALAARGVSAIGFDRFGIPNDLGSTRGPTRTFREPYFTDPRYVAMAVRSRERWLELEHESGEPLFDACGALVAGPARHPALEGVLGSLRANALPHEELSADEIARRWPALRPSPGDAGVFEERAGLLLVPATVRAHAEGASRRGATLRAGEPVLELALRGDAVDVRTSAGRYEAGAAVVTLGPWLAAGIGNETLLGYRPPLSVCRQPQLFFEAPDPRFTPAALCPFNYTLGDDPRGFYGVPDRGHGVMLASHYGGEETTADSVDRTLRPDDTEPVLAFARARMPCLGPAVRRGIVGLYSNTPDRHFLLGHHPASERVIVAGGFSGHGYKFAPVIGEIAADLALDGRTEWDIELFAPDRFAT